MPNERIIQPLPCYGGDPLNLLKEPITVGAHTSGEEVVGVTCVYAVNIADDPETTNKIVCTAGLSQEEQQQLAPFRNVGFVTTGKISMRKIGSALLLVRNLEQERLPACVVRYPK